MEQFGRGPALHSNLQAVGRVSYEATNEPSGGSRFDLWTFRRGNLQRAGCQKCHGLPLQQLATWGRLSRRTMPGPRRWGAANLVAGSVMGSKRAAGDPRAEAEGPEAGRSAALPSHHALDPRPPRQPKPTAVAGSNSTRAAPGSEGACAWSDRRPPGYWRSRTDPLANDPSPAARPITRNRRREEAFGFARARTTARLDGVKSMRNLMLATVSAIVLGMAGAGIGDAAEQDSSPTNAPGSAIETPRTMTASEILITAAQQQLKYSGLYDGSVDGKMSTETQRALRHFQQQHGLRQTRYSR